MFDCVHSNCVLFALAEGSFAFAFYMDRQKEERERGVTIACTTKEFYTDKWYETSKSSVLITCL